MDWLIWIFLWALELYPVEWWLALGVSGKMHSVYNPVCESPMTEWLGYIDLAAQEGALTTFGPGPQNWIKTAFKKICFLLLLPSLLLLSSVFSHALMEVWRISLLFTDASALSGLNFSVPVVKMQYMFSVCKKHTNKQTTVLTTWLTENFPKKTLWGFLGSNEW